ncbi:hypothetical protein M5E87_16235 [Flavonifractor plautii]|nr:hypothetical protein M5E87_16235 [Flavonifractor plautii]
MAHNGVLHNDGYLRRSLSLPKTKIETDSYIAVQLIEQKKPSTLTASGIWLNRLMVLYIYGAGSAK